MKAVCAVIIVIGITLGIGCLYASPRAGQPYVIPNRDRMAIIRSALYGYWAKHEMGNMPASLEEFIQYSTTNGEIWGHDPSWREYLLDTWGEPFAYESDGRGWYLQSSGADRVMGTADDIFYGEPQEYVDKAIGKARETPAAVRQGTNAVQGSAAGAPPPVVKQNPPYQSREEAAKEKEQAMRQMEKLERARRSFLRNAKVVGIALTLGICVAAVRARARKKAGRK